MADPTDAVTIDREIEILVTCKFQSDGTNPVDLDVTEGKSGTHAELAEVMNVASLRLIHSLRQELDNMAQEVLALRETLKAPSVVDASGRPVSSGQPN